VKRSEVHQSYPSGSPGCTESSCQIRSVSQNQIRQGEHDVQGLKNNCVNANNPEKRTKAKNAAKQGNAGERPDAAARYTVKSSGVNSLLFMNSAGGRCHDNARCKSIRGLVTRMKNELFYSTDYTIEQLKTMIWRYYMSYWNNRRICSSIGGVPPAEKRRRYYSDKTGKSAADTME